jgi:hypothetical protein
VGVTELAHIPSGRSDMTNPLDSIWGTIVSGFVLTAVLYAVINALV